MTQNNPGDNFGEYFTYLFFNGLFHIPLLKIISNKYG